MYPATSSGRATGQSFVSSLKRARRLIETLLFAFIGATAAQTHISETPITLETSAGPLHGSLVVPPREKPPVALIVAGSGPTDRDGNGPSLRGDNLKQLAFGLAARGVATVRYDKRGVAESRAVSMAEVDMRFGTFADDAVGWIRLLASDKRFSRVSVIGHSEGAQIAALAAQGGRVTSVVLIAGIAQRPSAVLRRQLQRNLPPDLLDLSEPILQSLEAGRTVAEVPPALGALFRPSVQPYLISWFARDPATDFAKVSIPALVVQGTTDIQVDVEEARRLSAANGHAKVLIVEGMNHVLKRSSLESQEQRRAYTDPSMPIVSEVVDAVAAFVRDH